MIFDKEDDIFIFPRNVRKSSANEILLKKILIKNIMKYLLSMTIVCNIWMICLELNWFFYDSSWMLRLSEFLWTLRSSAWIFFNNFLLKDATYKSKKSSDQKSLLFVVSLYIPFSFFASTPFKIDDKCNHNELEMRTSLREWTDSK